ncbi:hypothetical protein L1049_021976 [Liquidambar formosana]|uniref:Uncharacterized protein n=1 Tax=Liquidambar formosana TaxID=63359 RepID=A0AAP0RBQ9_LIQFO
MIGVCVTHVYLSKLDISADLTHPELYNQCTGLIDLEQNTAVDEDASNFVDVEEVLEAKVKIFNNTSSASLFAAINDSVLQRAMSLYKKQREEMMPIILPFLSNGEKVPFSTADNLEFVSTSDKEKAAVPVPFLDEDNQPFSNEKNQPFSNEDNQEMLVPASDQREAEISVPISDQEIAAMPIPLLKLEVPSATPNEKAVAPVPASFSEKPEELVSTLKEVKLEVDPVSNQETSKDADEDKSSSLENPVQSATNSPSNIEDMKSANDSGDNHSTNSIEEQKVVDTICGPLVFSDVSSEACEAVMPESVEFGSVNLSRIHHSPESTH